MRLHAITCYFNPAGYRRKHRNYQIFRRHLAVPLACVELSFTEDFELGPSDADVLVQIRGGAVLWQKERLLNLALRAVPPAYDAIAWVDADVVFERADWPDLAVDALRRHALVHLFHTRCNLTRAAATPPAPGEVESQAVSLGFRLATGQATPDDVRESDAPLALASTAGLAWAARRDLLAQHGMYDACILGTADRVMAAAAIGRLDYGRDAILMNERQMLHYRAWGAPFHAAVRGRVGSIEGRTFHLWHGELRNRRYRERHDGLRRYGFDPFVDIALEGSGCRRWNTDKPDLHAYVRDYFGRRDEDGGGRRG